MNLLFSSFKLYNCDHTTKGVQALKPTFFFKSLMASFNALTSKDQEEYMKLHNRFEEKLSDNLLPNDLFNGMEDGAETQAFTAQVLKVYGIYQTNNFDDGVSIKISRLVGSAH